jgi:hypothetical protein
MKEISAADEPNIRSCSSSFFFCVCLVAGLLGGMEDVLQTTTRLFFLQLRKVGDQRRTTNDDVGYLMLGVFFFLGNVISLQTSLLCVCCVVRCARM